MQGENDMTPNRSLKAKIIEVYGSQVACARDLKISEQRLSRIITGRDVPKPQEVKILAQRLGMALSEMSQS